MVNMSSNNNMERKQTPLLIIDMLRQEPSNLSCDDLDPTNVSPSYTNNASYHLIDSLDISLALYIIPMTLPVCF